MVLDLMAQLRREGKQTLQTVIVSLSSLTPEDQDWRGVAQQSISHCLVPGEDTECADWINITEVRPQVKKFSGTCSGCGTAFTVSFSDIATEY